MKITHSKEVFLVVTNTDLTEGRGRPKYLAVCEIHSTARRLAKGQGVMGSDADVQSVLAYKIGNRWCAPVHFEQPTKQDLRNEEIRKKRMKAIAKAQAAGLSEEDIKLLNTPHNH